MTWTVVLSVVIGIVIKMVMSPPSAVVEWVVSKIALHPKLVLNEVTITYNKKHLEKEEKNKFTDYFNEAMFLKQYDIFPGNEKFFLQPETNVIPFVVNVKRGKKELNFFVFCYADHVDVVKQFNKKVVSYRLRSDYLQKYQEYLLKQKEISI
ncbi:YfmQ family protein [Neobacillus sp. DY30]|uniref:YfmQ family protein n=1 Tax=Neobacillus sp. DY30 TaxID=3047871 RepID=UPI0024BFE29C|nr:YfmQ family protein [Neobacillus sp. DY30]WHX98739.1 YfmQ family protein [Neobacillus sp. DY30]